MIGAAREAVADTLARHAWPAQWRFGGWVAVHRHAALVRDVLACEPVVVHVPDPPDLLARAVIGALVDLGWHVGVTDRSRDTVGLIVTIPGHGHPVLVRLVATTEPDRVTLAGRWPCLPAADLLAATAARLLTAVGVSPVLAASWAIDLTQLARLVTDRQLTDVFAGLDRDRAEVLLAAIGDIPDWMNPVSARGRRDVADGTKLLHRLLQAVPT